MEVEPLPWNFDRIVRDHLGSVESLLDLGTGGGEWLASLPERPEGTVATESWAPNVSVARERLEPLGIQVVQTEPARDNVDQEPGEESGKLPFADGSLDLVVSRHESYTPAEVARVMSREGRFLTEQVSPGSELATLVGVAMPGRTPFRLDFAVRQLQAARLEVADSGEGEQLIRFADVGALAWYLKAVPWAVPGFTPQAFERPLRRLHTSRTSLEASLHGFWLEAVYG